MSALDAGDLAGLVNSYSIDPGPPKTIVVSQASRTAVLQDVTVTGILLSKQSVHLDLPSGARTVTTGPSGGAYVKQEADGDLHFCLGATPGVPHVACELQNAALWIPTFNAARGTGIVVSGYFRCLFEHPGFARLDDAHIFEIHPVRAVTLDGNVLPLDVDPPPDPATIHTWTDPHDLNASDAKVPVQYDQPNDILTFSGMEGQDENYITVGGTISNVQINPVGAALSGFTLTSPDITNPIQVSCLPGTTALLQLGQLQANGTTSVSLIGLRNIDLPQALQGNYVIGLLAISIAAAQGRGPEIGELH
jgi:hypothetical protein